MGASKVIVDGETVVDLTGDTATPETVAEGVTFHDAAGEARTGTMVGSANVVTVVITPTTGSYYTASMTFEELRAAYERGAVLKAQYESFFSGSYYTYEYYLKTYVTGERFEFLSYYCGGNTVSSEKITISNLDVVERAREDADIRDIDTMNVTIDDTGAYTSDWGYYDILPPYNFTVATLDGRVYCLQKYVSQSSGEPFVFCSTEVVDGVVKEHRILLHNDDSITVDVVETSGANGQGGADGISPAVSVEEIEGGHRITVTDADGEKTFDVMDGADGQDGTSVTVESVVESAEDGGENVVTFSDGKTLNVKNGRAGTDGENGKDYVLTDADMTEIAQEASELMGKSEQDTATLGGELVTTTGWTLGAGWSGSIASGFTHASGGTEPLTFSPSIKEGSLYQVTFKSSVAMTTDNLFVQVGNSTQFNLYFDRLDDGTISIGVLAVDESGLVFTPESSFTGTLTDISIKEITGTYEAVQQYFDTKGAVSLEIHVTPRGLENVFIGRSVGEMNTSGRANVGIGTDALAKNTSGFWNSAIGAWCLKNNTAGSRNIAIGYQSLMNNEVGQRNIGIGTYSLGNIKDGNWNIAIGADSMHKATAGNKNVAVGFNTLTHNQGETSVAIGADALADNTTGKNNVAVGASAMLKNTSGTENVAIGKSALQKNTTGQYNTAVGNTALYNLLTGQKNVAIGMGAGKSLTTGKRCIAIGAEANLEASVDDQLNIGNLLKGSLADDAAYLLLNGGLRLPSVPTAYSGVSTEVWNNGGVLMVGNGGMDTIVQAVISALPVYNGEVE
jgi:hypothetical protein